MKKPSGKILTVLFVTGFCITFAVFAAYHICRAKCPTAKEFFDSSALDSNAITAFFTALAFVGFVIISLYQAHCNAVTEQELEEEKRRNKKLQHDSMWLTIQIARLHTFTELKDETNRNKTIEEIEEHWRGLSKRMNDETK